MIPFSDANPTRQRPIITMVLIALCAVVYFAVQPTGQGLWRDVGVFEQRRADETFTFAYAAIPCELFQNRPLREAERPFRGFDEGCNTSLEGFDDEVSPGKHVWLAVLISMFLHGSVAHLVGNVLFLWVFGNNIEDKRGRGIYLGFYLVSGLVATLAHAVVQPNSTVPLVGASGAIAGVMGAYLVWFPNVRIRTLILFPPMLRKVTAKWVLGVWFIGQFIFDRNSGSVAWMAHVGGFAFGALIGLIWRLTTDTPKPEAIGVR
jgi:membrane associated rhomboid family serine protease